MNVQIETVGELTLGRTVCDVWGVSDRSPNADVGVDIDRQGFLDVLMDCPQRY
jgi:pyrimidine-specific ribonucleoside hydrolase